jgi:hypothetical protein
MDTLESPLRVFPEQDIDAENKETATTQKEETKQKNSTRLPWSPSSVNTNLCPYFEWFGWPLSAEAKEVNNSLPSIQLVTLME